MVSDGKNNLLEYGDNEAIVKNMQACYELYKDQPSGILDDELYSLSVNDKCEAIFDFLIKHTTYKIDKAGVQYIKSPARLLTDGNGDCKSFSMFLVCCLHCLGVPAMMRFVNFDGSGIYSHVYAVAIDECGREIILDACEKDDDGTILYGYARPYMEKKDIRLK